MNLSDIKLSVCIPVGPKPHHKKWLNECIRSAVYQTVLPDEIIIIDDMARLNLKEYFGDNIIIDSTKINATISNEFVVFEKIAFSFGGNSISVKKFNMPFWSGVVTGFNCGIGLASNDWVLQLGSDDYLSEDAIEAFIKCIINTKDDMGMYNFYCAIVGKNEVTSWPNHANVMSKNLFNYVGGYNPKTAIGGPDAAFNSILLKYMPQHIHMIGDGTPKYFVRDHECNYTKESAARYGTCMNQLRNDLTADWIPNNDYQKV